MKKFLSAVTLGVALTCGCGTQAYEISNTVDKLVMYVPNRVLDVLDIFSLSVGVGPVAKAELRATRLATVGAGIGATAKLVKENNRQYGLRTARGYDITALMFSAEKKETDWATRLVMRIDIEKIGVATPTERVYDFYDGARDYWTIGASLGLIAQVDFDVHVVEIVDLVTGIFFIDIKADDLDIYQVAGTRDVEL